MSQTIAEALREAEAWEYSQEAFELMKENMELKLYEMYYSCCQYHTMYETGNTYFNEATAVKDNGKIVKKEDNIIMRALKAIGKFLRILATPLIALFNKFLTLHADSELIGNTVAQCLSVDKPENIKIDGCKVRKTNDAFDNWMVTKDADGVMINKTFFDKSIDERISQLKEILHNIASDAGLYKYHFDTKQEYTQSLNHLPPKALVDDKSISLQKLIHIATTQSKIAVFTNGIMVDFEKFINDFAELNTILQAGNNVNSEKLINKLYDIHDIMKHSIKNPNIPMECSFTRYNCQKMIESLRGIQSLGDQLTNSATDHLRNNVEMNNDSTNLMNNIVEITNRLSKVTSYIVKLFNDISNYREAAIPAITKFLKAKAPKADNAVSASSNDQNNNQEQDNNSTENSSSDTSDNKTDDNETDDGSVNEQPVNQPETQSTAENKPQNDQNLFSYNGFINLIQKHINKVIDKNIQEKHVKYQKGAFQLTYDEDSKSIIVKWSIYIINEKGNTVPITNSKSYPLTSFSQEAINGKLKKLIDEPESAIIMNVDRQ